MKLLFISLGDPDYQCDCLLHGFYNLLGENLTHTDDYFLMYKDKTTPEQLKSSSGKGFTIWGNLPNYLNENSDIENKIKNKYFDYIIYGSIHRCRKHINLVLENYPKNKIAIIDGEDHCVLINNHGVPYFKRELVVKMPTVYPISFSIPEEKILKSLTSIKKEKFLADYIPQNSGSGYVYENETEYYKNYQEAYFGLTHKKGGWDCMRHYEILANYCVPHFPDLAQCPELTMTNFPKKQILEANKIYFSNKIDEKYFDILDEVFEYTKKHLTTKQSAQYVLDVLYKLNS